MNWSNIGPVVIKRHPGGGGKGERHLRYAVCAPVEALVKSVALGDGLVASVCNTGNHSFVHAHWQGSHESHAAHGRTHTDRLVLVALQASKGVRVTLLNGGA